MFKKLVLIVIVLIVIAFIGYNYIYQDHRDIAEEEAEFVLGAEDLTGDFMEDPSKAEADYLNKTLVVSGKISGIGEKSITLDNKVFCQFEKPINGLEPGASIKVKGRCIGFDDLLGQVKLDQCLIVQ